MVNKYKKGNQVTGEVTRVRRPNKNFGEILATVDTMLGANHLKVRCMDGKVRMARIPGKMRKRQWIREGDIVIIVPWEFQDEKADVKWRYTRPQVAWLRRRGYL